MANNRYEVGYAKTGKSGCKDTKCLNDNGKNIEKDSLRIGKITPSPFGDDDMYQWYHAPCIFNALTRSKAGTKKIESADDLEKFDELEEEDQELVVDLINGGWAKKGGGGGGAKKNKAAPKGKAKQPAKKQKKKESSEDDDDDDGDAAAAPAKQIHKGRVFAITGTLSMVRQKAVDLIEARGGTVAGGVTNKVTHLIAANPWMMTAKMSAAKGKGIEIVGEDFITEGKPPQLWEAKDVKKKAVARWQFLDNGNVWANYTDEANDIVEACYDDWLLNPFTPVRAVKSGDWTYTVNFSTLEQTNVQHEAHTVRKVRRLQDK